MAMLGCFLKGNASFEKLKYDLPLENTQKVLSPLLLKIHSHATIYLMSIMMLNKSSSLINYKVKKMLCSSSKANFFFFFGNNIYNSKLGEIMKMGYTFACFMRKKTVFSQVIQLLTYKSIFFI
jgi:hypothetical protein